MTSKIASEPVNLLLLWDAEFAAHQAFNESLVSCLSADQPLFIICCSGYISRKHSYLSSTKYDRSRMQTRYSRSKSLLRGIKEMAKRIIGKQERNSLLHLSFPNAKIIIAESLLDLRAKKNLSSRIFGLGSQELFRLRHRDYPVGQHLCVDMSLDCKSTGEILGDNTPELHNLRLAAYHSCLMVEVLHQFFLSHPKTFYRLLSTSVYSLDWVCRGFGKARGHAHLFLEQVADRIPSCKVYRSYSHDLVLRRQLQAGAVYDQGHLVVAIDYALDYLKRRLSRKSAHTYSPLATRSSELSRLSALMGVNSGSALWVYYTNSPDELVSIAHDHQCSRPGVLIPWDESGTVQDEIEALNLIALMAHQQDAKLVIRQHPRLGPESRSSFLSSEYRLLADCCARLEKIYSGSVLCFEPWDSINSYELALLSDRVVSFRGTMPLEASLLGLRPLVLAVNKGYMNFGIKLHAERAPRSLEELRMDLVLGQSCYSLEELASFLIQFYLVRKYGVLELGTDSSSVAGLSMALSEGSSVPRSATESAFDASVASPLPLDAHKLRPWASADPAPLVSSYLEKAYGIAADAFGFSGVVLSVN